MSRSISLGGFRDETNIFQILDPNNKIYLNEETWNKVKECRSYLEKKIEEKKPIYGVSTGFGVLASEWIPNNKLDQLQVNLIRSHAAGLGNVIPTEITKTAMILLINSLAKGHSGIRVETLRLLIELVNRNIIPVSYQIGSLGASGDLASLAHVSLVLIGEGEVEYCGKIYPTTEILEKEKLKPITLKAKEGLALINGTHFILAYSLHILRKVDSLIDHNVIGTCLSLEAVRGTATAFDDLIAQVRGHKGHIKIASELRSVLNGSNILTSHADMEIDHKVQDPYVFRCVPQVLGSVVDALEYMRNMVVREVNAVTDNPLIFPSEDKIISGGNFHAEPLAIPLETIGMALVEIGNVSEKRINRLVHPQTKELPSFLASDPGLESGYMITHYSVAALLNRARVLSHPAVTDNISVSGSQEDHVSMGMGSALKTYEILDLIEQIVAIEIYLATRGLNMQIDRPRSSNQLESIIEKVNSEIKFIKEDHNVHLTTTKAISLLRTGNLLD